MRKPLRIKDDYLNVLLDVASERTRQRGSRVYEIKIGLSLRELRLLRTIGMHPGITMGQLVRSVGIEKTLASKRVNTLVRRGLIAREIGTVDARQIELCLTDDGERTVLAAEPLGKKLERGFLNCLSAAEVDTLRTLLKKMIDAEAASRDRFDAWLAEYAARESGLNR
ncbi:MarR family transcriptional regulator [Verticiella sediminum]|uniref:MarR family transcriptional regulator n=1 Tax=Verticiella sediminum TaxID=1247510 RepID=A0A556APK9_9BURK|nr:MarR family transcriptional regulator [Verticiella sediminum]TSH94810.1 MarR family transcriptional regulator [Verticiella sediminum]